ncbi:MAG: TonB-dependent receptor, partial [Verrucomicrobia bacterium]|nr:TonB-dependent receptor [Verrucomicrobiota bacterium]
MSRYRTVMRVVGLATCIAGGAAGVQAAPEVLPEVVVTASREVEEAGEVMHSVEVVEGEEFVEKGYRTVPEALEQTPGVSVQKTTHGHGSPFIRGFTGRQNLLLVDGIRMNNSTYRGGPVQYWNTLDGFAMERMELVKSQGSVLYGSDALGGTLNVLSRGSGFEAEGPGMFWGGTGFYQYRTNGESQVGRLETRFGEGGKWGVLLGVTGKDFGDIRDDAVGLMRHTGYPEQDVDFKFEMLVDPDVKVTLAHQYLNQDEVYRWHSTVFNDVSWNGTATGTFPVRMYDQERSLSYLRFEGANGEGFVQNWSATVSYQKTQESEHQDRSPTDRRLGVVEVETYGLDVQMESAVGGGSLVYGVDYYEDHIDAVGWRTGKDPRSQRPMADDSEYRLGGVFAQYRRPVSERFELAGGVRYTRAEVELGKLWDGAMDVSARDEWDSVVFNVRGLYRPSEAWSIYGGASQGFRAPNVDDLSGNLTSRSGLDSMGSLDLSPEKTWTFELGTRVENAAWEVGGAVFYTLVDDLITTVPVAMGSSTVVST